jgi:hypothetical protein
MNLTSACPQCNAQDYIRDASAKRCAFVAFGFIGRQEASEVTGHRFAVAAVLAVFTLHIGASALRAQTAGTTGTNSPSSVSLKVKRLPPTRYNPNINRPNAGVTWIYAELRTTCTMPLEVQIRSLSKSAVSIEMEWYFVAKTAVGKKLWVYDKGSKTLQLSPMSSFTKEQMESVPVASIGFNTDKPRNDAGSEPYGYIVLIKGDGKVLKYDAQPRTLAEAAASPHKLKQLLITPDTRNPGLPPGKAAAKK